MRKKPFSERMELVSKPIQINDLDEDARTGFYNLFVRVNENMNLRQASPNYWKVIGMDFLKTRVDKYDSSSPISEIKDMLLKDKWYKTFDFMEFLYNTFKYPYAIFPGAIKDILEKENIGYRFIDGQFVPIRTTEEQESIEGALKSPYRDANNHIKKALERFSDRPNPDYHNSIKESISAVESVFHEITGEKKITKAVRKLNIPMHEAFKESIITLYGFTSNESGVRHGAIGESLQVNEATARYMLIVCSAMVNYITSQTHPEPKE